MKTVLPSSVIAFGSGIIVTLASANPKLVRKELAGEHLNFATRDYVRLDEKAGYYLISHGDKWETTAAALWLRPVHTKFTSPEYEAFWKSQAKRVTLPRLRNGKGVNIGDTPQQVQHKIGLPPQRNRYDEKYKWREHYYWKNMTMPVPLKNGKLTNKVFQYSATYKFLDERLVEIEYLYVDPHIPY